MALRGTLKDFGIADILQLISHQGKSGVLAIKSRGREIRVHFETGNIVNCENSDPKRRNFIGAMLVRADCISKTDLTKCLNIQKETNRQLGNLLLETTLLTPIELQHFVKLQITETVYGLFLWEAGTYAFTQTENIHRSGVSLRTENMLMEGLRQVDEWPELRRYLRNYSMTFQKVAPLEDYLSDGPSDLDDWELSDTLKELGEPVSAPTPKRVGDAEIKLYNLIEPKRDVQKLVDLSRLGEFEACRALCTLLEFQIIVVESDLESRPSANATVGGISNRKRPRFQRNILATSLLFSVLGTGYWANQNKAELERRYDQISVRRSFGFKDTTIQEMIGRTQMSRLKHFLEIYRTEFGEYPPTLRSLRENTLIDERDLSYPWSNSYRYSRTKTGYSLQRPTY